MLLYSRLGAASAERLMLVAAAGCVLKAGIIAFANVPLLSWAMPHHHVHAFRPRPRELGERASAGQQNRRWAHGHDEPIGGIVGNVFGSLLLGSSGIGMLLGVVFALAVVCGDCRGGRPPLVAAPGTVLGCLKDVPQPVGCSPTTANPVSFGRELQVALSRRPVPAETHLIEWLYSGRSGIFHRIGFRVQQPAPHSKRAEGRPASVNHSNGLKSEGLRVRAGAQALVEREDGLHVVLGKLRVEHVRSSRRCAHVHGLRDDDVAALQVPAMSICATDCRTSPPWPRAQEDPERGSPSSRPANSASTAMSLARHCSAARGC